MILSRHLVFIIIVSALSLSYSWVTPDFESDNEKSKMYIAGTTFKYSVCFKYVDDTTYTVDRYYKVDTVFLYGEMTKSLLSYYKIDKQGGVNVLYQFWVTNTKRRTTIDLLHLAAVFKDDSLNYGGDEMRVYYYDSLIAAKEFSDVIAVTATQYFISKPRRGTVELEKEPDIYQMNNTVRKNVWIESGIRNRYALDTETVVVPFSPLPTTYMTYDIERAQVSASTTGGVPIHEVYGASPKEVLQLISVQEWYNPLYGVVKREIESVGDGLTITMSLVDVTERK